MLTRLLLSLIFAAQVSALPAETSPPRRYNVLFIISDDMRAELGAYGGLARTPNLDKLAATGVRFDRGYTQYPLCAPSRASMLTGHSPVKTRVLGNRTWVGDVHPDWKTLPRWFKDHGYTTARSGKIFHEGIDDTEAWNQGGEERYLAGKGSEAVAARRAAAARERKQAEDAARGDKPGAEVPESDSAPQRAEGARDSDRFVVYEGNGENEHDYRVVSETIRQLKELKDQPFFLGCGLSKPHSPPGAPQKFYDLYDVAKIPLPVNYAPRPTVPEGFPKASIRPRNADLFIGRDSTPESAREMIRAYLASCSYADSNVGRVLTALDELGLADNTIVVFWGDHGYQLGERGKWSKAGSLFEQGCRTPYLIRLPGAAGNGQACGRVVEAVDFYATLVALCGLPQPEGPQAIEGHNLAPLLQNPSAEWNHPAYTIWSENGRTIHGTSVRNERWRFTEFADGSAMLFDEVADPQELKNVVDAPENAAVRAELAELVHKYVAGYNPPAP